MGNLSRSIHKSQSRPQRQRQSRYTTTQHTTVHRFEPGRRSNEMSTAPVTTSTTTTISVGSKRKIKAPHASTSTHRQSTHRRPAPLPARPSSSSHPAGQTAASLPLKTLQGARTKRTDTTKDGWERDVVFVTRNTPLGALMGRCRNLIMSEG